MVTWKKVAGGAAAVVLAGVMTTTPAGAEAGTGCDRGYLEPGAVTLAEGLALPRIAGGLAADPAPYTVAQLTTLFEAIDGNDDGFICLKAVSQLRGNSSKHHGFFYLADDNTHPGE